MGGGSEAVASPISRSPPTLDALLAERLDRLDARQRSLLEDGAVEGQLFHLGAVLALAAETADRAARLLDDLVRRELVRPGTASFVDETAYRFRHILIRDAAYRSLPKRTRGELHEQYAHWLEEKARGREIGYEEVLGYHFEQAYRYRAELGLADRALGLRAGRLLASAGRRALGRGCRERAAFARGGAPPRRRSGADRAPARSRRRAPRAR
jgi:predicted ATPase